MPRRSIRFTPFHVAGALFLLAGLVLAGYHGLAQFSLVPELSWVSWSHIHFVTIGGFTQLLFGMLPQLAARKLRQPAPGRRFTWATFLGLNGSFLLLWYGRGWDHVLAFDLGLAAVWLVALGLFVTLARLALQSQLAWDPTIALYLVAVFVFLWGSTYAYGLFAHGWEVPGGWLGLREAHVHAMGWGFLGLAAIGTLDDLLPRLLDTDLYSRRLQRYSAWLLAAGIFPLITGPWIGMGRTVTATGLLLFAIGFLLYLGNLVATYRAVDERPALATSILAAQFWMLGPAGFAPFVLFGVEWVNPAYIEDAALHFFFMGWALPIALAGVILYFRNLPAGREGRLGLATRVDPADILPDGRVPDVLSTWLIVLWNLAVLVVGVGFLYQNQAWSAWLFAPGYTALLVLWLYELTVAVRLRWAVRAREPEASQPTP